MDVDAVLSQMRDLGLLVDSIDTSGKLIRVPVTYPHADKGKKKSGWYVVHEFRLSSGGLGLAGAFGNYKIQEQRKVGMPAGSLSEEDRAEYQRRRKQAQAKARKEAAAAAQACKERAQRIWSKLPDSGRSEYLDRKGVRAFGVRFSRGSIVVPVYKPVSVDGPQLFALDLVSLQFIQPDGEKKFLTGTPKEGSFHWLTDIPEAECLVVIVEGYATGASIEMATGFPVAVAFDSGNLVAVAKVIRQFFPSAVICIAGDEDRETEARIGKNPGRLKAEEAAKAVSGVWVVPEFAKAADGLTDFNDLHRAQGLEAVRDQVMSAINAGPPAQDSAEDQSPLAPSDSGGAGEEEPLKRALQRYALIHGETKIFDAHLQKVFKQAGMKATLGNDLFNAWMKDPNRRTITWVEVNGAQSQAASNDPLHRMLDRFVYIYPTKNVWDRQRQDVVNLEALKAYMPSDFTRWMEHPRRVVIDQDNIVFDPTQQADPDTTINTFTGIPMVPDALAKAERYQKCKGIFDLLCHLCNHDKEVIDWVVRWLAYPLQNVGAKLDTALLFHSDVQGSGKSLFFGEVMRSIYGRYASILGQHQLESQYTDWRSRLLYAVFEEVLSRTEKHNQMGTIKHMISGQTQRIERKFVSGWEEANHMNGVFLSNEIQPFPLEPTDRRFLVVWPRKTLPVEHQRLVSWELQNGGPAAFYQLLLDYDLDDFNLHTKPLDTEARQRVIEFSLPNFEVFFRDWKAGDLEAPFINCTTRDLYLYYRRWCNETGNRPLTETKLVTIYSSRLMKSRERYRIRGVEHQAMMFVVQEPPADKPKVDELGSCVAEFRRRTAKLEPDE